MRDLLVLLVSVVFFLVSLVVAGFLIGWLVRVWKSAKSEGRD